MDKGLVDPSPAAEAAFIAHRGACAEALRVRPESAGPTTIWSDLWDLPIHLAINNTSGARRGGTARPLVRATPAHPHADLP